MNNKSLFLHLRDILLACFLVYPTHEDNWSERSDSRANYYIREWPIIDVVQSCAKFCRDTYTTESAHPRSQCHIDTLKVAKSRTDLRREVRCLVSKWPWLPEFHPFHIIQSILRKPRLHEKCGLELWCGMLYGVYMIVLNLKTWPCLTPMPCFLHLEHRPCHTGLKVSSELSVCKSGWPVVFLWTLIEANASTSPNWQVYQA